MRARIFIIWLIFYILGSGFASYFAVIPQTYLIVGIALILVSFLVFNNRFIWCLIFGVGLFFIAIFSFQSESINLDKLNYNLSGQDYNYTAFVDDPPIISEKSQEIIARIIDENNPGFDKKVIIYTSKYPAFDFGEKITFSGKIKKFDETSGRFKKENVIGTLYVKNVDKAGYCDSYFIKARFLLFKVRSKINTTLSYALPEREAGLASGLILGEKSSLSAETKRLLQASGTMHIIALSGYNITIILGLFQFFKSRFSRRTNLAIPLVFVILFVIMTGASPSIIRAAIMGLMPLLARCFGRNSSSFTAILFSAAVMLIFNPFLVVYDIGFQLSFMALVGMLYIGPILYNKLSFLPEYISFPISETLGAQLVSLPILMYYFGIVSVISPISNLVILSLVPLCMLVSFLIGAFGTINLLLGKVVAMPGFIILKLFNDLISFFGNLPFAAYQIQIKNSLIIFLLYFLLFDFWIIFRKSVNCIRE